MPPSRTRPKCRPRFSHELRAVLEGIPKTSEFVITYNGHGPTLAWFRSQYDSFFRGLEVERKTSHKLRHTFASYLSRGRSISGWYRSSWATARS